MQVAVGIDVGGTNTKLGLVTRDGQLLHKNKFSTKAFPEPEGFVNQLILNIKALFTDYGKELDLAGIGLGAPKANYYTGLVEGAANLAWHIPVNLQKGLQEHFHVPVRVTNDANLAAIGEKEYGAASSMDNFLSVTIGTGLGCGVFIGGKLQHGQNDLAGELGHTSVKKKGRVCGCGKKGCLETYVSAKGVVRTTYNILAKYDMPSQLRHVAYADLTPALIDRLANEGDEISKKVLTYTGEVLGYKLSDMVAMYNPEAIFLAGGVANSKHLFEPTLKAIYDNIYKTYDYPIKLLPSALKDDELAVLGGGALIWGHIEETEFSSLN